MKYSNLSELINADTNAKKYFNSLPDYIRQQIFSRSSGVSTFENLKDYAENLLRGDD
ncbi:MAG: hypothetical protein HFE59_11045 [Clostridiales bacterium]|nr:hypothetical protein [Clostridiales bacterium]